MHSLENSQRQGHRPTSSTTYLFAIDTNSRFSIIYAPFGRPRQAEWFSRLTDDETENDQKHPRGLRRKDPGKNGGDDETRTRDLCRDSGPPEGFATSYKIAGTAKGRLSRSKSRKTHRSVGWVVGWRKSRSSLRMFPSNVFSSARLDSVRISRRGAGAASQGFPSGIIAPNHASRFRHKTGPI